MNKQRQFEERIISLPQPDRSILIKKLIDIIGFENLKTVADKKIQGRDNAKHNGQSVIFYNEHKLFFILI
jgi:hypothetical protein